jgi:hypothetical protein
MFLSPQEIKDLVARILDTRQKSLAGIIETGKWLDELRRGTNHGLWSPLFGKDGPLQMSSQTAYDYIKIFRHETLSNPEHALDLPPTWHVLYILSHIPAPQLEELIADGSVWPGLQRKGAEDLVNRSISRTRQSNRKAGRKKTHHPSKSEEYVPTDKVFGRRGRDRDPGPVDDVLRDLELLIREIDGPIGRVAQRIFELEESSKQIQADRHFRDQARELADQLAEANEHLSMATNRLLAIVKDDPGPVFGTTASMIDAGASLEQTLES